jgi:hypothetical protein
MQCGLCNQEVDKEHTEVISRLYVCKDCIGSEYLPARITSGGVHLSYAYRTENGLVDPDKEDLSSHRNHKLSALAEAPYPSEIHANLQYEGLKAKMVKIFEKEIQVDDKEFDEAVWIHTNTPDTAGAFLRLSGVQSAILSMISMNGEIDIDDAKVYVKVEQSKPIDTKQCILQTAILLHYLTEFSAPV